VSWHSAVDMTTDMTTSNIEKTREGNNSVDGNCVREATAHQRKDYFVRMYSYTHVVCQFALSQYLYPAKLLSKIECESRESENVCVYVLSWKASQ
jgi:hypothetical protein